MHTNTNSNEAGSVLASLRSLIPHRRCTFGEALRLADLQAARLRQLLAVDDPAFPTELIDELPRIRVIERDNLPVSGASYWGSGTWTIAINGSEPWQRQRLTLLHEFKHIIDHGRTSELYVDSKGTSGEQRAEQAADFFAGSVLVPKQHLKRAYGQGLQATEQLAELFGVSVPAIEVRLAQTGLTEPRERCLPRHTRTPRRAYFRALHPAWTSQGVLA
jgi:Zn-dependent peptidase ImmA (M78 family)